MAGVCSGPGPCDTSPNDHGGKNWVSKAGGFPAWFHAIVNAMRRKGKTEGQAIQLAWGIVRNWAEGKGNVTPETRAKAAAMVARLDAMRGAAHLTAETTMPIDLAGTVPVVASNDGPQMTIGAHMAALRKLAAAHKRAGPTQRPKLRKAMAMHAHAIQSYKAKSLAAAPSNAVDLAASGGHHVPGTGYEWKHGYIPLTLEVAKRNKKGAHLVPKGHHDGAKARVAPKGTTSRFAVEASRVDSTHHVVDRHSDTVARHDNGADAHFRTAREAQAFADRRNAQHTKGAAPSESALAKRKAARAAAASARIEIAKREAAKAAAAQERRGALRATAVRRVEDKHRAAQGPEQQLLGGRHGTVGDAANSREKLRGEKRYSAVSQIETDATSLHKRATDLGVKTPGQSGTTPAARTADAERLTRAFAAEHERLAAKAARSREEQARLSDLHTAAVDAALHHRGLQRLTGHRRKP